MRLAMAFLTLAISAQAQSQAQPLVPRSAPTCDITLVDANVWDGSQFVKQTISAQNGQFTNPSAQTVSVNASYLFFIPPFADGHTHRFDPTLQTADAVHNKAIRQGVFYALNPNNIRAQGPNLSAVNGAVEVQAAGGGITRPGGHPQPLYENLARQPWFGLKIADLPGRAFHSVATPAEARAAVRLVKENGASVVKLYLLNHDQGDLNEGLTKENFIAAVSEAKSLKLRPIVHIESASDFRLAADSGVFAIMHLPYAAPSVRLPAANYMLTPEDAAQAARAGIIVVPTATVALMMLDGQKLTDVQAIQRHNLTLMESAGVKLAVGADNYSLGLHEEITTLRSFGIFKPAEIINMATRNGTDLAFPERKLGALRTGYEASFIGYYYSPVGAWAGLSDPVVGMRAGQIMFDQTGLFTKACKPSAEAPPLGTFRK